jgi:hypothetical protein
MSRRDDLKRLLVIFFFVSSLVRTFFPMRTLALSVVRLVEPARDGSVAIAMLPFSTGLALCGSHVLGGII